MRPAPLLRSGLIPARPTAPPAAKKPPVDSARHPERQRNSPGHSTALSTLPHPVRAYRRAPRPDPSSPFAPPPPRPLVWITERLPLPPQGLLCPQKRALRKVTLRLRTPPRPPSGLHRERAWSQGRTQAGLGLPLSLAGLAGVASACLTSTLPHLSGKNVGRVCRKDNAPQLPGRRVWPHD